MSNRTSKLQQHLLLPGDQHWELWTGTLTSTLTLDSTFEDTPGCFTSATSRRLLGLPASSVWVLPAWLKGEQNELRDIAQLHLERLRVRLPEHAEALNVESLDEFDGSHLTRIVALKDAATPLTDFRQLPDECRLSAMCYALPPDRITIWRELGRLVAAITVGPKLAYFSPMSAATFDHSGIAELNNICLQLSFQKVLTQLTGITLWVEDGDVDRIAAATGLDVARHDKPSPRLVGTSCTLMPADIIATRKQAQSSAKRRLLMLTAGFVVSACVAAFMVVMSNATRERDELAEKIAELTPRASKVANHKAEWLEVASATDYNYFPMELLLRIREPQSASDIALMSFECTTDSILLRGYTEEISPALKFMEDIKNSESLSAYEWEPDKQPKIENGVTFTIKGTLPQPDHKS